MSYRTNVTGKFKVINWGDHAGRGDEIPILKHFFENTAATWKKWGAYYYTDRHLHVHTVVAAATGTGTVMLFTLVCWSLVSPVISAQTKWPQLVCLELTRN